MNNCFIRNSDNPARVILFVNDVRRIDDLLASKSCGTGIKRIIYFRNCSGRYFSKKNSSLYLSLSLSYLRFHWADCMCPNNPSMIELLHIYRGLQFKAINTFRANDGNLEKSVRSVETKKRIELVFKFIDKGNRVVRNFYAETCLSVFGQLAFIPARAARDMTILPN